MSTPFLGEIRLFAGNYAPAGWELCNGQLLSIAQNDALFTLIGTTYGGDGQTTFALPDLRGRVPLHQGTLGGDVYQLGQAGGLERVALTANQAPAHSHPWNTSATADTSKLEGGYLANGPVPSFSTAITGPTVALAPSTIATAGAGQAHENMAPFLTVHFIISLTGVFPTAT